MKIATDKNKSVSVLLAVFLGTFGIHCFYLGYRLRGIIYLLLCWTGIPTILGLIDAIVLLFQNKDSVEAIPIPVKAKRKGSRRGFYLGLTSTILFCFVLFGMISFNNSQVTQSLVISLTQLADAGTTATPSNTPKPEVTKQPTATPFFQTSKGDFTIPDTGFIDGIDKESLTPLTVMDINIWQNPGDSRGVAMCSLRHGTEISIISTRLSSTIRYFEVRNGSCKGWVREFFVSDRYSEAVGELF